MPGRSARRPSLGRQLQGPAVERSRRARRSDCSCPPHADLLLLLLGGLVALVLSSPPPSPHALSPTPLHAPRPSLSIATTSLNDPHPPGPPSSGFDAAPGLAPSNDPPSSLSLRLATFLFTPSHARALPFMSAPPPASFRSVPLVCSGHQRPVVHLNVRLDCLSRSSDRPVDLCRNSS